MPVSALIEEIAELIYTSDEQAIPWNHAIMDDKRYYLQIADVVVDAVTSHLQSRDDTFGEALQPAILLLTTETDLYRLRGNDR